MLGVSANTDVESMSYYRWEGRRDGKEGEDGCVGGGACFHTFSVYKCPACEAKPEENKVLSGQTE